MSDHPNGRTDTSTRDATAPANTFPALMTMEATAWTTKRAFLDHLLDLSQHLRLNGLAGRRDELEDVGHAKFPGTGCGSS